MYRDKENAILGGVCAGLANAVGIPILIMRLMFLIAIFWIGISIWIYPILWLIMPVAKDKKEIFDNLKQLKLDKENKIIAGVCAGIANMMGLPPIAIRLAWIIFSLWLGFGIIAYLIMWILMACNTKDEKEKE